MSQYYVDNAYIAGPLVFSAMGNSASPVALPGDGILQLSMNGPGEVVLAAGSTLKGIHMTFADGSDAVFDSDQRVLVTLKAADGGFATVIHESGDVATLTDRIRTSSGGDITIGPNKIQVWFQYDGGVWRWVCPDWSVSAGSVPYTATDGHWVDPDPTTVGEALTRLANAVSMSGVTPIA